MDWLQKWVAMVCKPLCGRCCLADDPKKESLLLPTISSNTNIYVGGDSVNSSPASSNNSDFDYVVLDSSTIIKEYV